MHLSIKLKNHGNPVFLLSFYLYLIYSFTSYLKALPLMYFQLPYLMVCFLLLYVATYNKMGGKYAGQLLIISFLIVFSNYIFVYLQSDTSEHSFITAIGVNFKLFYALFPLLIVYSRCLEDCDKDFLQKVLLIIVLFTCITTIIGTYNYESPCRFLAAMKDATLTQLYQSKNIGGYPFIYFLVLFIPVLFSELNKRFSIFKLLLFFVIMFCIVRSEYTTALLLTFIALCLALILKFKNIYLRILTGALGLFLLTGFERLLVWTVKVLGSTSIILQYRLNALLLYYRADSLTGDMLGRSEAFSKSLNSFVENPIFGSFFKSGTHVGDHSEIIDFLGHSGIIGLLILIAILIWIRNLMLRVGVQKDRFLSLVYLLSFILSCVNTFFANELFFSVLVVPVLFFSKPFSNE